MALAAITLTAVVVGLTLLRLAAVSREVSRNNERIRLRDEDLATWIIDYDAALIQELRRIFSEMAGRGRLHGGGIVDAGESAKETALGLYAQQLKDAHRTLQAVAASEGSSHRIVRVLTGRPVPGLTAQTRMRRTISRWEEPATAGVVRAA
jgi:hypothetical protein